MENNNLQHVLSVKLTSEQRKQVERQAFRQSYEQDKRVTVSALLRQYITEGLERHTNTTTTN